MGSQQVSYDLVIEQKQQQQEPKLRLKMGRGKSFFLWYNIQDIFLKDAYSIDYSP